MSKEPNKLLGRPPKPILVGEVFKDLTVIEELPMQFRSSGEGKRMFTARCFCGNLRTVEYSTLLKGGDCGCKWKLKMGVRRTHGRAKSSEFTAWINLKDRCYNPNNPFYSHYGGRGITVCDRWLESFENFLEDMGERPSKADSIDRIDVDGHYHPDNCRWSSRCIQVFNQRLSERNTSGKSGVYWNKKAQKYEVFICIDGKKTYLGRFEDFEVAVDTREAAEIKVYGFIKGV